MSVIEKIKAGEDLRRIFPRNQWVDHGSPQFLRANNLVVGVDKLGESVGDLSFVLLRQLVEGYGALRRHLGVPLVVSSGHRRFDKQVAIWNAAVLKYGSEKAASAHVARPGTSPHNFGAAFDVLCPPGWTEERLAREILALFKRRVRVGYAGYKGQGFVHFDFCHLLVDPATGGPPDPVNHRPGVTW